MNLLQAIKQLRDDLKIWATNNFNALNAKIEEKTIPIDNELDLNSTNPVQNKAIATEIADINIRVGNESVANQITAAIEKIPTTDLSDYYTKEELDSSMEELKLELSESIVAEAEEWKIIDEAGNIIFSVDASGAHTTELTLNGESAATKSYVNEAISAIEFPTTDLTDYATKKYVDDAIDGVEIPKVDFTGYATETYVDNKVADLVNSAPEALNTVGELAAALENHEDAYDALLETVGSKATKAELENMKAEIDSETDKFYIADDAGNIIVSIDENGVNTTTVTAQNIVVNGNDVEEHIDNTDIHVTAAEKEYWNKKSDFSGSYNDLTDKPVATDLSNYYTKSEVDTAISNVDIDMTGYATEEYVTTAIENIDFPGADLSDYYTKDETDTAIESVKEELSESIISEAEDWKIVDNNGNIIATIDANGITTTNVIANAVVVNGTDLEELIATRVQAYIDETILGGAW